MAIKRTIRYPALADWINDRGTSYRWLAEKMGIQYRRLWNVLNFVQTISEADIKSICEVTGMTEQELRKGEYTLKEGAEL